MLQLEPEELMEGDLFQRARDADRDRLKAAGWTPHDTPIGVRWSPPGSAAQLDEDAAVAQLPAEVQEGEAD